MQTQLSILTCSTLVLHCQPIDYNVFGADVVSSVISRDRLHIPDGVAGVSDSTMLLDAKVTHVLNLAVELASLTYPDGIEVRLVELRDTESQDLTPYLDELVDYIHEVVTTGGKIVVHCVAGVSRSASTCIAYLVKHHQMSLREAHDHVKSVREVIYPNMGFWRALIDYEMKIRGSNSVELLPYVAGTIPSLDSYKKEMMYRMKLGWMDHVFVNIGVQTVMLLLQLLSTMYFVYDFT